MSPEMYHIQFSAACFIKFNRTKKKLTSLIVRAGRAGAFL
jgi:hypothetical protein